MNTVQWLLLAGIALGNNLDNAGAAVAYGLARIRIPAIVNAWIALITFVITAGAVMLGRLTGHFLPVYLGKDLSAVILCVIGALMIRGAMRPKPSTADKPSTNPIMGVLENPEAADADKSRHIDLREGTLVGIALSINNVGGGISAGLVHLSATWTAALSAVISFCLFWAGSAFATRPASGRLAGYAPIVGGFVLIAVGLCQFR